MLFKHLHVQLNAGVYNSIGANGFLTADPGMVHFGGFELGKVFRQVVRIVNTSPVSRRMHIIPPTTPHFKVGCPLHWGSPSFLYLHA